MRVNCSSKNIRAKSKSYWIGCHHKLGFCLLQADLSTIHRTRVFKQGYRQSRISLSTNRSSHFQWLASTSSRSSHPHRRILCGCYANVLAASAASTSSGLPEPQISSPSAGNCSRSAKGAAVDFVKSLN